MPSILAQFPVYIFKVFIQDWVSAYQLTQLDAALCNVKDRLVFLNNIQNLLVSISISASDVSKCFDWCIRREVGIARLTISEGQWNGVVPSSFPELKLRYLNISARQWNLVNMILRDNYPYFEEFVVNSNHLFGECTGKIPASCSRVSLKCFCSSIRQSDLSVLFSRVERLQQLSIKTLHSNRDLNSRLATILDKVGHSLTRLSLITGSHPTLQQDVDLISTECPGLVNLQLNVDCDEVNLKCLTRLSSLTHLKLKRIVIWEVDPGNLFTAVTHFSVPYDRLQAPKLRLFPSLTHLTLTGGTAPKAARLMLWVREYDQIRVMDVRECVFLDKDRQKLIEESEELVLSRNMTHAGLSASNSSCSSSLHWIFE